MKKMLAGAMIALAAVAATGSGAHGQYLPISLEARLDAGIPVGDSDDLDAGVGWGVEGALHLTPNFAVYGGYSRFEFSFDDDILDDVEIEDEGASLGGKVLLGTGGGFWNAYGQIGALFHDGETGLEAGLGAFYPVGDNLSLTPLVRYRTIEDLDYLTLGVGLNIRL